MKNQFRLDTTMILAVSVLTLGLFASAVGSMVLSNTTEAAKAEPVQLSAQAAKVRPVSI